ncbi:Efflux ABC transporter, permease/ATP-binding protein [hydrothermal vent metagenome]|uniref:Efflux ABC transporter, permease/ATP-binding protein n=1 Tax=hydrothermal vent metagenome TaxID=652676 RepID=A0A3B0VB98_9ZZZZ
MGVGEHGTDLSGGEWQKIAIARAFMRNANLLLLDEPTAALDSETESHLIQLLEKLKRGHTSLLISHRFSTVRMAGRIVVLEDGQITEQGTHETLLRLGGQYAKLYGMQAEKYQA